MGRLGKTAVAGAADPLALRDVLTDFDVDLAQMRKDCREPVIMDDLDHPAPAAADVVAGVFDHPVGCCGDHGAHAGAQVDAAVQAGAFFDRMLAHSEATGYGRLRQRMSVGDRAQHQALFECRVTGH